MDLPAVRLLLLTQDYHTLEDHTSEFLDHIKHITPTVHLFIFPGPI